MESDLPVVVAVEEMDEDSTMSNLLIVLQSEEADLLDKVLLEMLVEDIKELLEEGGRSGLSGDVWTALERWRLPVFVTASLQPLPGLVSCADSPPAPYRHKFALNVLTAMVAEERVFTRVEAEYPEALSVIVEACSSLDVDAALCLPLAAAISACLQHRPGRRWSEKTGAWSLLVSAMVTSGGGKFRPALRRLLVGRLVQLWMPPPPPDSTPPSLETAPPPPKAARMDATALEAAPVEDAAPLEAVTRFLVVPARRLMMSPEDGVSPAWLNSCELLLQMVQQLLKKSAVSAAIPHLEHHRQLLSALTKQVAVPMEVSPVPFVPAQLYVGLHLLDQSASEATVTSAAKRACRALSRQTGKDALRTVTTLALDACLTGGPRCCHLSAVAAALVWNALRRWRAADLTPEENGMAEENRKLVEEFVADVTRITSHQFPAPPSHLAAVLGTGDTGDSPPEGGDGDPPGDLDLVRTVFTSRADRPLELPVPSTVLCRLVQPWLLLLKYGVTTQVKHQASVLSLTANLCGPADVTGHHCDVIASHHHLTSLADVAVRLLKAPDVTERVAVCALQCLSRCCRLLPPACCGSGAVWTHLAALLTSRLAQPTGEDSMDAAGEAVLALVRSANHNAARGRSANQRAAESAETNGSAAPPQPANEEAACPLTDWLATNRLASTAVTSLLEAGPGGRRVAHWLIEEAAGPVWEDIEDHVDFKQLLDSSADGDVVLDSAPLEYLRRRLSRPPAQAEGRSDSLPPAVWSDSLPLLQTALCSGESAVRAAACRVYCAAVTRDLSRDSPVSAATAAGWLTDGAARALLSLASGALPCSSTATLSDAIDHPGSGDVGDKKTSVAPVADRREARALLKRIARLLSGQDAAADDGTAGAADGVGESVSVISDRLEPGALQAVRGLCGRTERQAVTEVDSKSRDPASELDSVSRDAVISSVLAQSTKEFFGGRVGGGGGGGTRLKHRPEVAIALDEFLAAAAAVEAADRDSAIVVSSIPSAAERTEALVCRVVARVQEVFRCATMDQKTDIPTDCY